MNTLINVVIISLIIGLLIYIYFAIIKKLSNNYKVILLPLITLLISVVFGYKAFKTSEDVTLIIWLIIFFTSILLIGIIFRKIYLSKQKEVASNKTVINNYSEQNYNITNIEGKLNNNHVKEKKKNDDNTTNKKSLIILTDEQLRKIYNFFVDNNLLADYNLEFEDFKDSFLLKPLRLKAEVPTLRVFYNHLCIQNNINFKNIKTDFLTFFINSKNDEFYDYKQFTKDSKPISNLTDEILKLFEEF
ncbi:hypothetical protein [Empedobacter tilapiae]